MKVQVFLNFEGKKLGLTAKKNHDKVVKTTFDVLEGNFLVQSFQNLIMLTPIGKYTDGNVYIVREFFFHDKHYERK